MEPRSQMMLLISLIICSADCNKCEEICSTDCITKIFCSAGCITWNSRYRYEYRCRNSCQEAKIFLAGKSPTFPASCNTSRKFTETFLSIALQESEGRKEKKTMRQIRENRSQRMIFEGGFAYGKWKTKV